MKGRATIIKKGKLFTMPTFYEYMMKRYLGKNNRYGDLAMDMYTDQKFPRDATERETIKEYLKKCGACENCMLTFKSAWTNYRRALRKNNKTEVSE